MEEADMDRQILVTGGTGFLGSYLIRLLLAKGYSKIRATRRANSSLALLGEAAEKVEWVEANLLDPARLEVAFQGVEEVYHCAAIVSFDPKDRKLMRLVNVEGTATMVDLSIHHDIRKMVYVSSVAALGRRATRPEIDEKASWERTPLNSQYAITKYQAEMEVWRGFAEGLKVAMVNPSVILGSGFWNQGTTKIFQNMWNGFPFYPTGGTGFVDVRDVADFAIRLMESDVLGERFVLNAENIAYKDLFRKISEQLQKRPPFIKVNTLIRETAWRVEWLRTRLMGGRPFITRETARNSMHQWLYKNEKSKEWFDFSYTPISKTIEEASAQFLASQKEGKAYNILPLK
jgi:dihydroflavonol-4-reductase